MIGKQQINDVYVTNLRDDVNFVTLCLLMARIIDGWARKISSYLTSRL